MFSSLSQQDRRFFASAIACSIAWGALIYFILAGSASLPCGDSLFHIKLAEIMREQGGIIRDFYWATCSVWKDAFYDKDLLFHLFLAPFTLLGKINGAKFAVFLLNCFICFVLALVLRVGGLKSKFFVALAFTLFSSGAVFMGRLVMCRPHLFSILFLLLGIYFVFTRKRFWLAITAFFYSLTYAGAWQLLCVIFLFDFLRVFLSEKSFSWKDFDFFWALGGFIAGILLNPYFPANISGSFMQSIEVLKVKWLGAGKDFIVQANELSRMDLNKFLTGHLLLFSAFLTTIIFIFKKKREVLLDWRFSGLMILSAVYFFFTLLSMRFAEYYVPVCSLFLSLFWLTKTEFFNSKRRILIVLMILGIVGVVSVSRLKDFSHRDSIPYERISRWLNENLLPGEIVFTGDWDDTPFLFYGASKQRYLVFLEPYFMFAYSPEKYRLWNKISYGKVSSTAVAIRAEFGARAVFVTPDRPFLLKRLLADSYARLVCFGSDGEALFLLDVPEDEIRNWEKAKTFFKKGLK